MAKIYRCQKVPGGHLCPATGCVLVTDEPCPCHCVSMSEDGGVALYVDWTELKPTETIITLLGQPIRQKKFQELVDTAGLTVMHSKMSEEERTHICPRYPFQCEGCRNVKDPKAECTLGWIKQRLARDTDKWFQETFKGVKK